jgi:hypothetical protein
LTKRDELRERIERLRRRLAAIAAERSTLSEALDADEDALAELDEEGDGDA